MDKNQIVKIAIGAIQNKIPDKYSGENTSDALRNALIEANGGETKLNIKTFHRGNALFEIIEELIPYIAHEGLTGDEFFMAMVEYRNLKLGDMNEFYTEDKSEFIVADAANGTQGIRRQRLNAGEKTSVQTQLKVVKVYEELNRLLAGRVDFNTFVDKVGEAMTKKLREDIYNTFKGITETTAGLNSTYVKTGTADENRILELIEHVEASTGKTAKIIGTKMALRKVPNAIVSDEAKSDMYNIGHYGKFNGTEMVQVKQQHQVGTDTFILDNDTIYIIASDDKPIKVVDEGEGLLGAKDPLQNADLTQEYLYGQMYGVALLFNEKIGIYKFSA